MRTHTSVSMVVLMLSCVFYCVIIIILCRGYLFLPKQVIKSFITPTRMFSSLKIEMLNVTVINTRSYKCVAKNKFRSWHVELFYKLPAVDHMFSLFTSYLLKPIGLLFNHNLIRCSKRTTNKIVLYERCFDARKRLHCSYADLSTKSLKIVIIYTAIEVECLKIKVGMNFFETFLVDNCFSMLQNIE